MAEKTLGFTKPKVKAQRIQLSTSFAQANRNLQSQKPSFGESNYSYEYTNQYKAEYSQTKNKILWATMSKNKR